MSTMKNSSLKDQMDPEIILWYVIAVIIFPFLFFLVYSAGDLSIWEDFFLSIRGFVLIVLSVAIGIAGHWFVKKVYGSDYGKYDKIEQVTFNEEYADINTTEGKTIRLDYDDIMNVDYFPSYEIEESEYSRNNLVIQINDDEIVYPYTSRRIYHKFLDILDGKSLRGGYPEE